MPRRRLSRVVPRLTVACVVIASLVGCGSESDVAAPTTTSEAPAADRAGTELLVIGGTDLGELAVVDAAGGDRRAVAVPVEIAGERPSWALSGPAGAHVLLSTGDTSLLWNRADDEMSVLGFDDRVLGFHPPSEPTLVLLRTNTAALVVDLARGRTHDLTDHVAGWPEGVAPRLSGDTGNRLALVVGPSGGAVAIDLETGAMIRHDDSMLFYPDGVAPDGRTVVGGRRSEHGRAVVAVDPFEPASAAVRYTPADPMGQVTIAWMGAELVAIDLAGRILALTETGTEVLVQLSSSGDRPIVASLHTETSVASGVVIETRDEPARWFHLDATERELVELTDVAGHEALATRPSAHVVAGRGSLLDGYTSLQVVAIADGSIGVLRAGDAAPTSLVRVHAPSLVEVIERDDDWRSSFHDPSGRVIGVLTAPSTLHVDADVGMVAWSERGVGEEDTPTTWIARLDGSVRRRVDDAIPLLWLPAGG